MTNNTTIETCKKNNFTMPEWLKSHLDNKNKKFNKAETMADLVIAGPAPAFLLTGQAGIGKSKLVKDCLLKNHCLEGFGYEFIKGHGSPQGLYAVLYRLRKQIAVFDDADSIFQDSRSVSANILKAALDSYGDRWISWESSSVKSIDVPNRFLYEGKVIFISNIDKNDMDEAVLTRCFKYNLVLTPEEILAYMYNIIEKIENKISMDIKMEVLYFMEKNISLLARDGRFNLRSLINGIRLRTSGDNNWEELFFECV